MFKVKDIVYCDGCKIPVPLARRTSTGEMELIKFFNGKKSEIKVSYQSGSSFTITCTQCGMGHIFLHIEESISLNEKISLA